MFKSNIIVGRTLQSDRGIIEMTRKPREQLNHGSQKRGRNEGERKDGGGVQRQKLQEDKNSFSKSREQRVLSEKVHASVKTRLKGNRRLSAGQSGRPKPKRETSGGGGTCQGRGPINPGWVASCTWNAVGVSCSTFKSRLTFQRAQCVAQTRRTLEGTSRLFIYRLGHHRGSSKGHRIYSTTKHTQDQCGR